MLFKWPSVTFGVKLPSSFDDLRVAAVLNGAISLEWRYRMCIDKANVYLGYAQDAQYKDCTQRGADA